MNMALFDRSCLPFYQSAIVNMVGSVVQWGSCTGTLTVDQHAVNAFESILVPTWTRLQWVSPFPCKME